MSIGKSEGLINLKSREFKDIGLIGPETSESRYVLFELGAAWGRGAPTFPLLVLGASADDVPGPLRERLSISVSDYENCLQLIDDIGSEVSLPRKQGGRPRRSRSEKTGEPRSGRIHDPAASQG